MKKMTEMQARIMRALRSLVKEHNRPIRRMEIEDKLGMRLDGYLLRMVAAGYVKRFDYAGYLPSDKQLEIGP